MAGERASPERAARKAAPPEMTERQIAQRDRMRERNLQRDDRPEAKFAENGEGAVVVTASDDQDGQLHAAAMMEALGTRSLPFLNATMDNINRIMNRAGAPTEQQYNMALAILASVQPENELEATLASQMVAANECAFRCMQGMKASEWADQHKMYGDMANKFMRTFTAQCEALARLRRGGEQIVKHVYVQEGGQAVIAGTVNTGGRGDIESVRQPCGTRAIAPGSALPGSDPARDGVPISGNAEWAMPHSRRAFAGSAER